METMSLNNEDQRMVNVPFVEYDRLRTIEKGLIEKKNIVMREWIYDSQILIQNDVEHLEFITNLLKRAHHELGYMKRNQENLKKMSVREFRAWKKK